MAMTHAVGRSRKHDHDEVIRRWREGQSSHEIAAALGVGLTATMVRTIVRRAGLSHERDHRHVDAWAAEARRRRTTAPQLKAEALRIIVDDNLFDAVLGDE